VYVAGVEEGNLKARPLGRARNGWVDNTVADNDVVGVPGGPSVYLREGKFFISFVVSAAYLGEGLLTALSCFTNVHPIVIAMKL
jgi:hypothetical protein